MVIEFFRQEIADCFQVLSGILNVGNIKFATKDESTELFVNTTDSIENGKQLQANCETFYLFCVTSSLTCVPYQILTHVTHTSHSIGVKS